MGSFADLCDVADRNGLAVEIVRDRAGATAVWVIDDRLPSDFRVAGVNATMRRAVVASPFWRSIGYDERAPQLIGMLAQRGYR